MNSGEHKVNILLVDDRPENLLALEAIIERDEYQLIKASSGEEALKFILKYDFAVILLDVQMPGIDGFGTAKIIKAREKTKNIPIIFITANNMDSSHIFAGYSVGAIDYILKPFDPIILKKKVEGFVELYRMNQRLVQQAESLAEKTKELEKAYNEVRISEALANVISETSIDSMLILDEAGTVLKVNPAVETMFHYTEAEIIGQDVFRLFTDAASGGYIRKVFDTIRNTGNLLVSEELKEVTAARKDGSHFPAEIQFGKRLVQNNCIVACTIRDVTKKKQDQDMITFMAYHDALTQLPNWRLFHDRLNEELQQARLSNQTFSLMYLDMDRFKYINDSLGHLMGDRLLRDIAKRLSECMRPGDFAARVGGDEFNILLPKTNRETALDFAEGILEAFKRPFLMDNYELFLTTSIGISVFPFDGEEAQQLLKNADAALFRAKEQGKNRYKVFHSGMNIGSYRTFVLQNDLRKAIDRQEFQLVYQPRIGLYTGEVTSAEALIRWNHPNWGIIMPSEFIPIAEESGQIVEIGEWVLRSACKQMKAWQHAGIGPIRVAVNFSALQFLQRDLLDKIQQILVENDLNPEWLELEITESAIMGNEEHVMRTLQQLRQLGVSVSIDDFGTGYSSLQYLRSLPVKALKLDKSFVQDIFLHSSDSTPIIKTIISLAHNLQLMVIAEGVETEEQLNMLREHECDEVQGYLLCRPVEITAFEAFLHSHIPLPGHGAKPLINKENVIVRSEPHEGQNQEILDAALNGLKETYSISPREFEVFQLMVNGFNNKEISDKLFISEHTVKNHITRIFQKLNVTDRIQAMAKIYQTCIEEGKSIRSRQVFG